MINTVFQNTLQEAPFERVRSWLTKELLKSSQGIFWAAAASPSVHSLRITMTGLATIDLFQRLYRRAISSVVSWFGYPYFTQIWKKQIYSLTFCTIKEWLLPCISSKWYETILLQSVFFKNKLKIIKLKRKWLKHCAQGVCRWLEV